jgi:hypothetical protein
MSNDIAHFFGDLSVSYSAARSAVLDSPRARNEDNIDPVTAFTKRVKLTHPSQFY